MTNTANTGFGFLVHDIARLMRWHFDRQSAGLGLTLAQWAVLAHLKRNDGVQQKTLAQLIDIKPITLARHIDRLEAEGWVQRRDDPDDRRAKRVYLLPKAKPKLESLQLLGQKVRKQALEGVSEADEAHVIAVLQRVLSNLSETRETVL